MTIYELNLDGLVGPTHHYAGLSFGNLASTSNALSQANPKAAALQGIEKMRLLHQLGIKQAVLPPHQRPNLALLHRLGFKGSPQQQIGAAFKADLGLLSACYSASSMWTANAATVSSSKDSSDNRVHFTPANLVYHLHRHEEAAFSHQLLKHLFKDETYFQHHPLLPSSIQTSDEGAANHMRLCKTHHEPGINVFVYGKKGSTQEPSRFPARQSLEAQAAIARSHGLSLDNVLFARQNPKIIDEGVFHNDVIALSNESLLILHEKAWVDQKKHLHTLASKASFPLSIIEVSEEQLSVHKAIKSYLFNSQLITLPNGKMTLIAPQECQEEPATKAFIDELIALPMYPIETVHYLSLRQSMRNGGGPACLRLRVPLSTEALSAMHQGVLVDETLLTSLELWVKKHYRTTLEASALNDPLLIDESFSALDELTTLLNLGAIYPFQKEKTS